MTSPRITLISGLGAFTATSPNDDVEYAPPLGVLTLAALLRDSYPVQVVDLDDFWRRAGYLRPQFHRSVVEAICATGPDIIGFSSISGSYPLTIRLAEECSRRLPKATVILGGPQATVTDVDTLTAFPFVDMILRGEADDTFPALVTAIASGVATEQIAGLTFRDRGGIRRNPNASATLDLDRLPLPAYDLVPRIDELQGFALEAGRGCPYACTFCSTNDFFRRRFRLKSPSRLLDEMNRINQRWRVKTFELIHDMFTVDRRKVIEFCEAMIEAGSPYKWSCSARTDSVDTELLRLMKRAGCHDLFFGIETGSQRMQRVIDKDLDLAQARHVLQVCNDLEIRATASLIVGYPQETKEDLRDTVAFLSDVMVLPWADPQLNVLSPLAGTPITTEYWDQLTLDEHWTRISENGSLQDAVDQLMIAAHPELFPNFYAFPFFTDRNLLQRLRYFFFFSNARCGCLMRAVHLLTPDMLAFYELWEKTCPDFSRSWFDSMDFVEHLISFCQAAYPDDPAVRATAQFCRKAFTQAARPPAVSNGTEPYLMLADRFVLVDCDSNINAILAAQAQRKQPDPAVFATPVTVAVKVTTLNRSSILRFPPIAMDLLRHAERASTLSAIEEDFEERQIFVGDLPPSKVVAGGIAYLEKIKAVKQVFPDHMAMLRSPADPVLTPTA